VLKGVSLAVPEGGIVALLGANGAGKTTTLKAISNLLKAERGEVTKGAIHFEGARIDSLNPSEVVKRGVIQVMEGGIASPTHGGRDLLTGAYTRGLSRADLRRTSRRSTVSSRA
jgi:branched-chain amino acid transport system ATP-binding protein